VVQDIAHLLEPIKKAIRTKFLPALYGIGQDDIDHELRNELALAVSSGGIGISNPMTTAPAMFDTLVEACSELTASLVNGEALDILAHGEQVGKAVTSAHKTRSLIETGFINDISRGKPAVHPCRMCARASSHF